MIKHMKRTIVLKVDAKKPEISKIRLAADTIKKGGIVAFPTETVYGLGVDALNPNAVKRLFNVKRRPFDNPPIVHIGNIKDVSKLASNIPAKARELMRRLWPGPITLILKRSEFVPEITVCGLKTIAIRMPNHNVALSLIRESQCAISAPSANLAGKPSPTTAKHVLDDLAGGIDIIVDAGPTPIGIESTVLDLTIDPPQILRPGGTTHEVLEKILGKVELHPIAVANKELTIEKVCSPGLKHRHYAPDVNVVLVEGELPAIIRVIKEKVKLYKRKGTKIGVLATDETANQYEADVVKSLGTRKYPNVLARNLFSLLREFDQEKVDIVIAEGISVKGLGLAIMNRLRKASGYNIVNANGD